MPTPIYQYATIDDMAVSGIPHAAIANFTPEQKNSALKKASSVLDGYFRAQFGSIMPFTRVGEDVKRATCIVAAFDLVTSRGYNPSAGADPVILTRYREIIGQPPGQLGWADLVSNGKIHPDVGGTAPGGPSTTPARARAVSASQRGYSGRPGTSTGSSSDTGPFTTD